MKVVLDTNIVISRFLSPHGSPAQIMALLEQGIFELSVSADILAEYEKALNYDHIRKRHGFTFEEIAHWVQNIKRHIDLVPINDMVVTASRDPDDNKFLECAIAGGADYIVSGDAHLLSLGEYKGVRIISPADFLAVLSRLDAGDAPGEGL
jgi:putative PIN family toxin of toxin-antitoxin system